MPHQSQTSVDNPTATTHHTWGNTPPLTWRRPGRISLTVIKGPGVGQRLTVDRTRVVIGRSRTADVVISHPSVSGAHFELRLQDEGIELRDLESTNGTWLGSSRVHHATVWPRTTIRAGECQIALSSVEDVEVPVSAENQLGEMYGRSPVMRELFASLSKLAATPLDVLVTGETGTGKELAAQALHQYSSRVHGPWVVLDCGTQGPTLIEAVLFGYRRGAFTGAEADRPGLIETAHGGTLFIDEVGELPLDLQVKLLRALDKREVTRIGETQPRKVDIRVVAATHRNLVEMVAKGAFREDLLFRLSQAQVEMPPLRSRSDDVVFLAERFLEGVARAQGTERRLSEESKRELLLHRWRGNVRELKNIVERDGYLADGPEVSIRLVPTVVTADSGLERLCGLRYQEMRDEVDRVYLARAMADADGKIAVAAKRIGVDRGTLRSRLKELGLYPYPSS